MQLRGEGRRRCCFDSGVWRGHVGFLGKIAQCIDGVSR